MCVLHGSEAILDLLTLSHGIWLLEYAGWGKRVWV